MDDDEIGKASHEQIRFVKSLIKQLARKGKSFQLDKSPDDMDRIEASETIEKMLDLR